ncbi:MULTISPECIES: hypothetical protein [Bradyrhizobium]|nr:MULTISPECIES: hypothetical protein [Bradyrhizobium]
MAAVDLGQCCFNAAREIAKARQHGWIDAERQAIRAHIEHVR